MIRKIFLAALGLAIFSWAVEVPVYVSEEVLTIDQNNQPSVAGVLGTVSDVAALQADIEINAEKERVYAEVYDQTTNLLDAVAAELTQERVTVYRKYFLDSFTVAVLLDPDVDKCAIYNWERLPDASQTVSGRVLYYLYFGCTQDISAITPQIKYQNSLDNGVSSFSFLDAQYVTGYTPMSGTWTDSDGNSYSYLYRITVSLPSTDSNFCLVHLNGDASDNTGDTLTVINGITGGVTTNVVSGNLTLHITGGICTGVTDAGSN